MSGTKGAMNANIRAAIEALEWDPNRAPEDWPHYGNHRDGWDAAIAAVLNLIPPNAILIDPTAPETVAALAGAVSDTHEDGIVDYDSGGDEQVYDFKKWAAAILPAFVARLRGKP
jgi:hypothetical protein